MNIIPLSLVNFSWYICIQWILRVQRKAQTSAPRENTEIYRQVIKYTMEPVKEEWNFQKLYARFLMFKSKLKWINEICIGCINNLLRLYLKIPYFLSADSAYMIKLSSAKWAYIILQANVCSIFLEQITKARAIFCEVCAKKYFLSARMNFIFSNTIAIKCVHFFDSLFYTDIENKAIYK